MPAEGSGHRRHDSGNDAAAQRSADSGRPLGAYGLQLRGLDPAARWLAPQDPDAPVLELVLAVSAPDRSPSHLDGERADIRLLGGGRLRAQRGDRRFTLSAAAPIGVDELAHPYLAPAAALLWQWVGMEALHAGVAAIGERAVLVLGGKASGKSTLLATLHGERGYPVLADDLAVIREGRVLAGPRAIDLRPGGPIESGTLVRRGDRARIDLGPAPNSLPLAGTLVLAWGAQEALEVVPGRERLAVLASQRSYPLPGDPVTLLELAAAPMFRLTRPRGSERRQAAEALLRCFA